MSLCECMYLYLCVKLLEFLAWYKMCVRVCACVRVCLRACVCVRVRVFLCVCVFDSSLSPLLFLSLFQG